MNMVNKISLLNWKQTQIFKNYHLSFNNEGLGAPPRDQPTHLLLQNSREKNKENGYEESKIDR